MHERSEGGSTDMCQGEHPLGMGPDELSCSGLCALAATDASPSQRSTFATVCAACALAVLAAGCGAAHRESDAERVTQVLQSSLRAQAIGEGKRHARCTRPAARVS
jgi:hypothetical protein